MNNPSFSKNNWIYRINRSSEDDFDIQVIDPDRTKPPQVLYKYYSLSSNSFDATSKGYLYASHPFQFNDPYDCNKYIFDLSETPLQIFDIFFKGINPDDRYKSIGELYVDKTTNLTPFRQSNLVLRQIWGCFNLIEIKSPFSAIDRSSPYHTFAA